MKTLSSVLLLFGLAAVVSAQGPPAPSAPPDVMVLQQSWRSYVRNPKLDEDPFIANDERREALRTQEENRRATAVSVRTTGVATKDAPRKVVREELPAAIPAAYVYNVKIRNTGEKTIRLLVWEYVFFDPDTQKEMGNHQGTSKVKIRSGKSQELSMQTASPPAQIIDAKDAGKPLAARLSERVVIHRVEYEDGSIWERPTQ